MKNEGWIQASLSSTAAELPLYTQKHTLMGVSVDVFEEFNLHFVNAAFVFVHELFLLSSEH